MIQTGFERRVKVQQIIENQLPQFILSESPKAVDFLKQYYISQAYQSGPSDIAENLDQYLKLDNLTPEVIAGETVLYSGISSTTNTVQVYSTKGFPQEYGLFQIDSEIFTYTGITTNTFTGCIRGFSGITTYQNELNPEELIFKDTEQSSHIAGSKVKNLSSLFLKEFYKKLKYTFTPGLEDVDFVSNLDVNNFIKEARSFYEAKGTEESFKILFKVLYGVTPKIVDLEKFLIKPSSSNFLRREIVIAERISGDPNKLVGQTIKKSTDETTQASVSEVEIFTRSGISTYFKISLFVGFDEKDLIEGNFTIQPKTKVINPVSLGSSVITVDSTIGFGATGTLVSGNNIITYTNKSINQFLGCSGVSELINTKSDIRTNEVFVGYENGDLDKKVEIIITGVLSDFEQINDIKLATEGQKIYVKNVGEKIKNPQSDKTYKEIIANSWIYNTSSRFEVDDISGSTFTLKTEIDKSSLTIGDKVDILIGNTENIAHTNATVSGINLLNSQITLDDLVGFTEDVSLNYSIRRKLKTATSSGTPLLYGNNTITSNIQNLYNERDEYVYVASNSLPSYDITKTVTKATITSASGDALQGYDPNTDKYSILSFNTSVPFITGDEVYYTASSTPLSGIEEGTYYVKVLSQDNKIKLYQSRSLIESDSYVEFNSVSSLGSHTFTLSSQRDGLIYPQKLLKKFSLLQNIKTGNNTSTSPGSTGMLVNGVEIVNYKSSDKVYYGPLESIKLYNGGNDYDVINPPIVDVGNSVVSGGTTALVRPIVRGSVQSVLVDPQDFDLKDVISVTISGGNGNGAILEPVLETRYREVEFDSRPLSSGGGVDVSNDTITFTSSHNFRNGDALVYNRNGNNPLGLSTISGNNNDQGYTLSSGSVYYTQVVNNSTIKLYQTLADYSSGINTLGITTSNAQGIQKFRTYDGKKTLRSIKVINPGSNYENRKLIVNPSNISTVDNSINFENHGFSDGDIVRYSTEGAIVTGLSSSLSYYILKENDNKFRLANAGVAATITDNYTKRKYVNITSSGSGYQTFAYPDITLTINAEYDGITGIITATPILRGEIVDLYLYEVGTGYGSTILNFHKKPNVKIRSGKDAEIKPFVSDGKIIGAQVTNSGSEYTSAPDLTVVGIGSAVGAKLRAVISGGKVTSVVVLNPGSGYTSDTTIKVTSVGSNAFAEASVRGLTLNNYYRFGNEILTGTTEGIEYGLVGYSTQIGQTTFDDDGGQHSPIIGWAYDGNPIYGPYAYADPYDINSSLTFLESGYLLSTSDVIDRPSGFAAGFFVEDYKFNNSGDLDQYNGRFAITPDFPQGVYAYYAGIKNDISTNTLVANFPYFIGDSYRSLPITQNLNQEFDFNSSNLIRNTFPYKVSDLYSNNDFISEPNEVLLQSATIESVTKGSITDFIINGEGEDYTVGDVALFNNEGTNGGGLSAYVYSVTGKPIVDLQTSFETYQSASIVWENPNEISLNIDPYHTLLDKDSVIISGVSTFIKGIADSHIIGVSSEKTYLIQQVPSNSVSEYVDDIYVSNIPTNLSVGSTVAIGTERLSVLNIFPENKIIRVVRGLAGAAHTASTEVTTITGKFTIPLKTAYFDSKLDDKIYFNPQHSVGIGQTTGIGVSANYVLGDVTKIISIPVQSIYLPNHPFKTNQEVIFKRVPGTQPISVSRTETSSTFNLPSSGNSQTLYVINKSKDYIGLCTQVGLTTNTNGLYFRSFTSNGDSTDYRYSLESNFTQSTAKVQKIKSTISVSTDHGLSNGDTIKLSLKSDQSVGIGTSTYVAVRYNSENDKLLINPIGFGSTSVNILSNELEITSHGLKTGDKIFYNSSDLIISGLETGSYYVYRIDDNKISLTNTQYDAISSPPSIVSFGSTGGSLHEVSKINPELKVIRNNNLVFDVSHSSLSGYNFKIYYDKDFNNELISIGSTDVFSVVGVATVGVATTARVTLNYSDNLPSKLFYTLEKSGFIGTSDTEVKNRSQITFVDSVYNGSYTISGIGSTTFQISLKEDPESSEYYQSTTSLLKYSTTSPNAKGGVDSMRITSSGSNYKKLPKFVSIASTDGSNADIIPVSTNIGRINEVTINDPGFNFSVDRTLSPEVYISPNLTLINRNTITRIDVVSGGSGYTTPPDLIIVNPETGNVYDTGILEASIQGSSISSINIIQSPKGLSETENTIYTINNTNGVGINSCISSPSGIITCVLATPILGFTTDAFLVGDEVFVEGIRKIGTNGSGFNSEDYDYNFFPVTAYRNTNPAEVEFDISEYATNAGIAVTDQNSFASLVRKVNYPVFDVIQTPLNFIIGEKIYTENNGSYIERDLIVTENLNDLLKVYGTYDLQENDVILGKDSGTIATIKSTEENKSIFKIDYSLRKDLGWSTDIGKLDEDYQVTPDNDYYQNLSYTVKSPIEYEELVNSVNRLVHTTGLKNFADTGITSTSSVSVATTSSTSIALIDIISENRVDTINNFDFGIDIDVTSNKSKFIKLKNRKLSDYISCITNRVLRIDDVNLEFSDEGSSDLYKDLDNYDVLDGYSRYLVQISSVNDSQKQVTEIITLPSTHNDIINLEKGTIFTGNNKIGDIYGNISEDNDNLSLRFVPEDPYNYDYDIKIIKNNFNSTLSGINTESIGFINLTGSNIIVGVGSTSNIIEKEISSTESLFANIEVVNSTTSERTYVELYVDHDNTNTYITEYYFDNDTRSEISDRFIGTFSANISSGVLSLKFENTENNSILVRSKVVGFGTTASGIGTYRFKADGQPDGSENSARLQSNYSISSGISTIISVDKTDVTTLKSIIKVGYGNTSALHQLLTIHDSTDVYTMQYPFLSIGSTSGIGTFGSEYSGSNLILKFYPDSGISDNISVQVYSEIIQTELDSLNITEQLSYGPVTEDLLISLYNSINGNRVNKTDFDLKYFGNPIFEKTFNPSDTNILDLNTGIFTIEDHFFNTGERLIYKPGSTFVSVAATSIETSGGVGLSTEVYAIRINRNEFQLASSKANAISGTELTFTSYGGGNAHTLEMYKKMEKTIISIDGVVQSPLAYTPINYTLTNNGGQIGAATTFFAISGISSILPNDILKIDDEFLKVNSVGLGTTSVGPITGTGSFNIIESTRGFVGTSASSHSDGTEVRVYLGAFNIVGSKVHFTEAPKGNTSELVDSGNIPTVRSSFGGRVYLRQDYSTNQIYDNISKSFTGIGKTYTLSVQGINTTGIETGSGILFINDVFQTPTTVNNIGNNYNFIENSGISSVVFAGITSTNNELILSDYDVNTNQLPRGGIIVSLGSTSGLGFAPLVGASVTAVVSGGVITSVGLGTTDIIGSGYRGVVSIGVTDANHTGTAANITATVGVGGTLTFNVVSGGSGYVNPSIFVSEPNYENLSVIGVSRLGIGSTTITGTGLLVSLDVGSSSTTGIGSTLFEVKSFKISRPGYGFRIGDVFKPVGLVTDRNLAAPLADFELTVLDTFSDSFSAWQFGELDFIDSISNLQNGTRTRFPLYYNGQLLSFETDSSSEIDLNAVLLIFVNGVIQEPGVHYQFEGGTSFTFTTAPTTNDNISVFFYRGTRGTDSISVNINETIRVGDSVLLQKNVDVLAQSERTIYNITASDKIETNIYSGLGISETSYRPLNWIKQKVDKNLGGDYVYKSRDSIESLVYPTAKIIGNLSTVDSQVFVDNAQLFNYEENESSIVIPDVNAIIVQGSSDPVAAAITAVVSAAGTISSLIISNGGSGYTGSNVIVKISAPKSIGVGIGTTATAIIPVVNGSLSGIANITNPGFGYTYTISPQVLAPTTNISYENILDITTVQGTTGIITGITTTVGSGSHPLALKFFLNASEFTGLSNGYPIYVYDTVIGSGVTSVNGSNNSKVGIGTTFVDNVYIVRNFTAVNATNASFVADILSTTNVTGLTTTGSTTNICGKFSWGRLSGFTRSSSPISIGVTGLTVDSGLSTFPSIQRRGYGLRDTGALRKDLG